MGSIQGVIKGHGKKSDQLKKNCQIHVYASSSSDSAGHGVLDLSSILQFGPHPNAVRCPGTHGERGSFISSENINTFLSRARSPNPTEIPRDGNTVRTAWLNGPSLPGPQPSPCEGSSWLESALITAIRAFQRRWRNEGVHTSRDNPNPRS